MPPPFLVTTMSKLSVGGGVAIILACSLPYPEAFVHESYKLDPGFSQLGRVLCMLDPALLSVSLQNSLVLNSVPPVSKLVDSGT